MAHIFCNFFSYSLGYPVDIELVIPSLSPCDMGNPEGLTHQIPAKFPILYLLHGHGNDYLCWSRFTSMERYVEERRIAVVTCSVGNKRYMNTEYGENYYDFIEKELPEFVLANFPISDKPEDTYLAGLSMGGYGTLAHGLGHPWSYRAIGCFSPAVELHENATKRHDIPPVMDIYQTLNRDLEQNIALPDLFLCIGKNDFLYDMVEKFHTYLTEKSIPHRYDSVEDYTHEWAFWDLELPLFLDWLPRTDIYASMPKHPM